MNTYIGIFGTIFAVDFPKGSAISMQFSIRKQASTATESIQFCLAPTAINVSAQHKSHFFSHCLYHIFIQVTYSDT